MNLKKTLAAILASSIAFGAGTTAAFAENIPVDSSYSNFISSEYEASNSKPIFQKRSEPLGALLSTNTKTYVEGDFIITETTNQYQYASRANKMLVETSYSVKSARNGQVMIIHLDGDFIIEGTVVSCPRYYSSYSDINESLVLSYEETDMTYKQNNDARGKATITTKYEIVIKYGTSGSETKYPKLFISMDNTGYQDVS